MVGFYKIPSSSLPHILAGGITPGAYFVERDGWIQSVVITLDYFAELVGDINIRSISDNQLSLGSKKDWDFLLDSVDSQITDLSEAYRVSASKLEVIHRYNERILGERPAMSLGYLINRNGNIEATTPVILSLDIFKSMYFKAYPHMAA